MEQTKVVLTVRIPQAMVDRADVLLTKMERDPKIMAMMGRISRGAVIRIALSEGLTMLEAQMLGE